MINLFANYWVGEHQTGLLTEDLEYLYHKITLSQGMIFEGLFEKPIQLNELLTAITG